MARQIVFLIAIVSFVFISFMLYLSVDSNAKRRQNFYGTPERKDRSVQKLLKKVNSLKQQVNTNEELVKKLNSKLTNLKLSKMEDGGEEQTAVAIAPPLLEYKQASEKDDAQIMRYKGNKVEVVFDLHNQINRVGIVHNAKALHVRKQMCPVSSLLRNSTISDFQMLNVYESLPFDNPDGGVWKQGWNITYDARKIREEKRLEVIVIPHSHNDPGWIRTFEDYFEEQTKNILDKMVTHLTEKPDMKFIYAEMSFFELWWSKLSEKVRERVKRLTKNGQLEIATGGWVMTDEANAHYYSIITEMMEGHEFIRNQLGVVPSSHWSIDPFGLSPTLAYLLNRSNLTHMAIQRVHYSVKKHLAKQKALEFKWRQLFADDSGASDITTHLFPFFSYDVPHTCGPDPKVCCQFDFRRLHSFFCPWGKPPLIIDSNNVDERAALLADQYRKKAQLYKENTLLIPLGDDFRYDTDSEWNDQYNNYKQLMDHMNEREEWNMRVRFGTLADYFSLLDRRLAEEQSAAKASQLPVLSGDFFTYADRDDHYWSGYFTSRPFYKHMDRTLQHFLRSADILFSLASAQTVRQSGSAFSGTYLYDRLIDARRALSLFQHHDGVTGTAKSHVVVDYGQKMLSAINNCKDVITFASEHLMKFPHTREGGILKLDEEHFVDKLPRKIVTEDGSSVLVFNSLGHAREEVTCIHVGSSKSRIIAMESGQHRDEILQQIGPIFYASTSGSLAAYKDKFELCFLAKLPALGYAHYNVIEADDMSHKARIHVLPGFTSSNFETKVLNADSEIFILNSYLKAVFDSKTGFLKSVTSKAMNDEELHLKMSFVRYGARPHNTSRNGDSLSGAYLFLPDGPAKQLDAYQNVYAIVEGPIRQSIFVIGPIEFGIQQTISLDVNGQALSITNHINLASGDTERGQRLQNNELAMRLSIPSLASQDYRFYTDLNGFQMIRRRKFAKLPLQAQFYPMSGAMFVENSQLRVSLLGRQALGAASLQSGTMEVMLDRRLVTDDDRGLGQGVLDNLLTQSQFHLFIESFSTPSNKQKEDESTIGYHSLPAHHLSLALHYPPILLVGQIDHASSAELLSTYSGLDHQLPCDIHLVALRTTSQPTHYGEDGNLGSRRTAPETAAALVLHRLGADCRAGTLLQTICENSFGKVSLAAVFKNTFKHVVESSLTLLHSTNKLVEQIQMEPMELRTVKLVYEGLNVK